MEKNSRKNNISVTILGSGTCVPSLDRSSCSVLIQLDEKNLVFDAGPGTMRRLTEAGVSIFDVSHIFFSHLHPDHTGELVPFLFANKYPDGSRRKQLLSLCGGTGFLTFYKQLKSIYNEWIDVSGRLKIIEFDHEQDDAHIFDKFTVTTTPVEHSPESIAFKVTTPGGSTVVYSGDTDFSENLIALAQNADLFICESALPDHMKVNGHLTPSLAGRIASRANVKKLVLTHFYPECDQPERDQPDIREQCRKTYAGPLILAEDLLTIQLD
ncbi:MAG: MBL fold metallo-hydrolase [Desulfobacteraceae bacterium]|nr:MBL fold metallo-hydrolase [Desulfobacteraceae bacterium]MBC2757725.1 MBL fold metallo-hydrolase [Desulfobacteraceae bacterium]